ncbi:hypothetical protein B484DRAFT_472542, partial [Ochromonadaceae sp. CCMP2298]
ILLAGAEVVAGPRVGSWAVTATRAECTWTPVVPGSRDRLKGDVLVHAEMMSDNVPRSLVQRLIDKGLFMMYLALFFGGDGNVHIRRCGSVTLSLFQAKGSLLEHIHMTEWADISHLCIHQRRKGHNKGKWQYALYIRPSQANHPIILQWLEGMEPHCTCGLTREAINHCISWIKQTGEYAKKSRDEVRQELSSILKRDDFTVY